MLKKKFLLILFMFISATSVFSNEGIAPYILDGSLVIYFPNVKEATDAWRFILKKTEGAEYANTLARLRFKLQERMVVNIFEKEGAESLGIDYNKGFAYVHLKKDVGYAVMTIKNEILLRTMLDNLPTPMPYRIEKNYVIFSGSKEILEYYNFQGLKKLEEYQKVVKNLKLDWNKSLVWMDSIYIKDKISQSSTSSFVTMGDRVVGTFNISGNNLTLDLFSFYDDPRINQELKNSTKVKATQKMTLLDFESGTPGIVGHTYVNLNSFLKMLQEIDRADYLSIKSIANELKDYNIDVQEKILPYLKGRFSYVIRAFDVEKKKLNFTISSEIQNKKVLAENIKEIVRMTQSKGAKTVYKNMFTQQFYGWKFNDVTLWVGIVEDHLIISSDEASLALLVENIYQSRSGFLQTLPVSFRRFINNKSIGGQMILQNPSFIKDFNTIDLAVENQILMSLEKMDWSFYLINNKDSVGRRDIIILKFYE